MIYRYWKVDSPVMTKRINLVLIIFGLLLSTNVLAQYDYDDDDYKPPVKRDDAPKVPNTNTDTYTKSDNKQAEPEIKKPKKDKKFDITKMRLGGFFGASFGTIISVNVEPAVSYLVHERVEIGGNFIFQYTNCKSSSCFPKWTSTYVGGAIWPRVYVWEQAFVQLEYRVLNGDFYTNTENRTTFHTIFAGGGYNAALGGNAGMSIAILVNLTTNDLYPTIRPIYRLGFGIGLGGRR